jgi:hypothetical protein
MFKIRPTRQEFAKHLTISSYETRLESAKQVLKQMKIFEVKPLFEKGSGQLDLFDKRMNA